MILYYINMKDSLLLPELLGLVGKYGDFYFSGRCIYLCADEDFQNVEIPGGIVPRILTPQNYGRYCHNYNSNKWCSDILSRIQLQEYENSEEGQQKLKAMNDFMDKIEKGEDALGQGNSENTEDTGQILDRTDTKQMA